MADDLNPFSSDFTSPWNSGSGGNVAASGGADFTNAPTAFIQQSFSQVRDLLGGLGFGNSQTDFSSGDFAQPGSFNFGAAPLAPPVVPPMFQAQQTEQHPQTNPAAVVAASAGKLAATAFARQPETPHFPTETLFIVLGIGVVLLIVLLL